MGELTREQQYLARLQKLAEYKGSDEVITFEERRKKLIEEGADIPWSLNVGIPTLDNCINGFHPGNVIVVSGPTSQGKSTICHTMTSNICKSGHKCLWFPFEDPTDEFLSGLPDVTIAGVIPAEFREQSLDWIQTKIEEAIAKFGIKVVFIDHLHYLFDLFIHHRYPSLVIGSIMRRLKTIAAFCNVVIFIVSHIKTLETIDKEGNPRKPVIGDLRDSSFTGQEPNYVIMLWRKQHIDSTIDNPIWLDEARLSLQKNRRTGKLINIDLIHTENGLFVEMIKPGDEPIKEDWTKAMP